MADYLIHAVIAIVVTILYSFIDIHILAPLAVVVTWYQHELAQRIAKDALKRGALYWYRIDYWGDTARKEFMWPAIAAILTGMIIYHTLR